MSPSKKKLLAAAEAADAAKKASAMGNTNEAEFQARAAAARAYALSDEPARPKKVYPEKPPPQGFLTTPPVRPTPPPRNNSKKPKQRKISPLSFSVPSSARRKIPHESFVQEDDDDYARFVRSLDSDLPLPPLPEEDEDYQILEDESEDDEDDVIEEMDDASTDLPASPVKALPPLHLGLTEDSNWENSFYSELEEELGGLLEEDLEAALHVLGTTAKSSPPEPCNKKELKPPPASPSPPCTPLRETRSSVSKAQVQRLQTLLAQHYQLLVQQSVLAVRAAHKQKSSSNSSGESAETAEDLAEILDGAVGMLQDLNQNRKDAIRNSIQLETTNKKGGKRSLLPMLENADGERRLTRSAFTKTLENSSVNTCFDVCGLASLSRTFGTIDRSVSSGVLQQDQAEACRGVLRQAGARIEENMVPGMRDMSLHLSRPKEVMGKDFEPPMTNEQKAELKKNRNQFTAAEDNLVLRGVNLYGEKQWLLIADRYLPDRSVNIISQRYSKLCVLLYKAQGVYIDDEGNLETPPKNKTLETLDEPALSKLKRVEPPAILNVHRWSLEEDLTLLKAVPLLGSMWAELSTRFIPHRDRGHLRKRYQVLERRVKATVQRAKRGGEVAPPPKPPKRPSANKKKNGEAKNGEASTRSSDMARRPLPHPGAPEYLGKTNGWAPPNKSGLVRKPVFQLPVRGHPTQMLLNAATNPHFAGVVKGGRLLKPVPTNEGKYDSLPEASSPELDAAGTHGSSKQDISRTGFEKILEEGTNDWSQMPRIKKMMENETESMVASAIVSNLANAGKGISSERGSAVERLPHIEVDSTTSSGFSVLNDTRDANTNVASPTKAMRQPGTSIMASVLERTRKAQDPGNSEGNRESFQDNLTSVERSPQHVPSTPSRPSLFAVPTTPIGLSPGLKSSFLSPAGFRSGFTPTGKTGFTPTGSSIMWNAPSNASADGYELCNFELSDRSRQAIESNGRPMAGHPLTPSTAGFFADGHSLMANDFEAISALNSLSNSPARSLLMKRPNNPDTTANAEKNGSDKTSFFAKAIGGIHDKESKKRRVA